MSISTIRTSASLPIGAPADLDESLSSTTPDVSRRTDRLTPLGALGWGIGLGVGAGVLLLRPSGAGWGVGALATGAWKGALVGAGAGAALLGLDAVTGGEVKRQFDFLSLDRRAQILFVLRNATNPWVAPTGLAVARDAKVAQDQLYGTWDPKDGPQDAFRHAYAAGLFSLRAMRDHAESPETAHRIAIGAGDAHEVDGQDNNDDFSRAMDTANNRAGITIVGDGRARAGEQADPSGFVTERALRMRVLEALAAGDLRVVERSGDAPRERATNPHDLPRR